jgi:hypothetical protein
MTNLVTTIENDDLESFKKIFDINIWQKSITQIENYAKAKSYDSKISYDDCDVLKYSLHCNANSIFKYLLPLLDPNKHGNNYGWPILSMALKNERYDYAHLIINHPKFDLFPIYHMNCFKHIESRNQQLEHIEFLFEYFKKFEKSDFRWGNLQYYLLDLICYSEETYQTCDTLYKEKLGNPKACILDLFENKLESLGTAVFYDKFQPFILDKLDKKTMEKLLYSIMDNNIVFYSLFESKDAIKALTYLIEYPDFLQSYFNKNPVIAAQLSLDGIIFLIDNNIDLWNEKDKYNEKGCAVDYLLDNKNLSSPITSYFVENYTEKLYNRLKLLNFKTNIVDLCEQKIIQKNKKDNTPK